jgi:mono/diheme cytochrome c family protein
MVVGRGACAAGSDCRRQRDVAKVYAEVCSACHGAKLEGGKAQTLLDDAWVFGGDDDSMATTIREAGRPRACRHLRRC